LQVYTTHMNLQREFL